MGQIQVRKSVAIIGAALALPLASYAVPAVAQASMAMLNSLDTGAWELRFRDGSDVRKICVRNGREFIQLRHRQSGCNRYVVEDGKSQVTVQYTCPGNGYGRTNIRKESGSLVQIDSQGIADGRPFQFSAEARRIGTCN